MFAQSVLGRVPEDKLGITLCHEHIFDDLRSYFDPSHQKEDFSKVNGANAEKIRLDPISSKDNLLLSDLDLAIDELSFFTKLGGRTIVECSPIGVGRNLDQLRMVSKALNLNIIAGTGFYIDSFHPPYVATKTETELAEIFTSEIRDGIGEQRSKCGMIGEIGTGSPVTENEKKVLRAAVESQRRTGAPITIHTWSFSKQVQNTVKLLQDEGATLEKVVLGHIDYSGQDPEYHSLLAKSGCFLGFDNFGSGTQNGEWAAGRPTDDKRVTSVIELVKRGFISQILISQDISFKTSLRRFGGQGYDHILRAVVPRLKRGGLNDEQLFTILEENPKRLLSFLG